MNSKFYSAYQFMPINRVSGQTVDYADIAKGKSHIRHDYWQANTLSGRINCEITLQSPTFVGAEQIRGHKDAAAEVKPYKALGRDGNSVLALPANSLRGMVSHVAEALSLSAMRVLTDESYSVRKATKEKSWREPFGQGKATYEFAKQAAQSENIVPWNPERKAITPAEALFGVVETDKDKTEAASRNLAGRVRFSDALPAPNAEIKQLDQIKLSILSSPKPPSPRMYFTGDNAQTSKSNSDGPVINGRKFYLHHTKEQLDKALAFWQSHADTNKDDDNQRMICGPLAKDNVFQFHVDFDNLTAAELELLLVSLQPKLHFDYAGMDTEKSGAFWHKLGLGKPLGLGSVLIRVGGVCFIDRQQRYRTVTNTPRYARAVKYDNKPCKRLAEEHYAQEKAMLMQTGKNETMAREQFFPAGKCPDGYTSFIDLEALKLLLALRHPDLLEDNVWVTYPVTEDQLKAVKKYGVNTQGEGYRWFQDKNNQELKPLNSNRPNTLRVDA